MNVNQAIKSALGCPSCHAALPCACGYTAGNLTSRVPVLTPNPELSLAVALHQLTDELESLKDSGTSNPHKAQIVEEAYRARKETLKYLFNICSASPSSPAQLSESLQPFQAGRLTEYSLNVLRDWGWDTPEWAEVMAALPLNPHHEPKTIAILGSGAGRIALELSDRFPSAEVLAIDQNLFLTLFADQMIHEGKELDWNAFNANAFTNEDLLIQNQCSKKAVLKMNSEGKYVRCILGDALSPPLRTRSVDLLVLPWIVDVLPKPLDFQITQFNACLSDRGEMILYGPLAFPQIVHPKDRPNRQDLESIIENHGFKIAHSKTQWESPLASPQATRRRQEQVLYIRASKEKNLEWMTPGAASDWWHTPVALTEPLRAQALRSLASYEIITQIDGVKTPEQLATLVAYYKKISTTQAKAIIEIVLAR